jgi:hypothetical protein
MVDAHLHMHMILVAVIESIAKSSEIHKLDQNKISGSVQKLVSNRRPQSPHEPKLCYDHSEVQSRKDVDVKRSNIIRSQPPAS